MREERTEAPFDQTGGHCFRTLAVAFRPLRLTGAARTRNPQARGFDVARAIVFLLLLLSFVSWVSLCVCVQVWKLVDGRLIYEARKSYLHIRHPLLHLDVVLSGEEEEDPFLSCSSALSYLCRFSWGMLFAFLLLAF